MIKAPQKASLWWLFTSDGTRPSAAAITMLTIANKKSPDTAMSAGAGVLEN